MKNRLSIAALPLTALLLAALAHHAVGRRGILLNKGANRGGFGYFLSTPPLSYGSTGGQSGGVSLDPGP